MNLLLFCYVIYVKLKSLVLEIKKPPPSIAQLSPGMHRRLGTGHLREGGDPWHMTLDFRLRGNDAKGQIKTFYEIITRNARLLGHLAASGILHTAPIPLFHNRVQSERRNDNGLYEWPRGGRLDQWLNSCRFPNIGKSGIRAFEHFITFNGSSRKLYEFIGTHIFSLILIAGSYFRNHDIYKMGFDDSENPIDARNLFDKSRF